MYDRKGHRITTPSRKGSKSPLKSSGASARPSTSPFVKPARRALGATPPPAEMDEVCAMRWRKYNAILESICRDSPDEDSPPPRPPAFDYRGVELIAALAPGFGKYLFLAKAKSFSWWKNSTAKPKIFHSESPRKPSPTRPIAANGVAQPTPNRRLKISAKFSERWKVSTGSQQTEDCGSLSTSKQYDLRQLKKDQQAQQPSPEKDGHSFDSPGNTHTSGAGDWSDVDLNSLGLMPDIIYPLFHANEGTLWTLFRDYVLCEDPVGLPVTHRSLALSTSREQKTERMETRLMPFEIMWTIVRDFDISPDFCNKSVLQQSVKYVQYIMGSSRNSLLKNSDRSQGGSLGSTWAGDNGLTNSLASTGNGGGFSSTGGSKSELGSPKQAPDASYLDPEFERLSFSEFLKVLWQLSIRCTDKPPNSHPIVHAQMLFRIMDSSDGRNRMAKRHRTSSIVPRFIGCNMKDNATATSSRNAPQQSGIMQYLRKVMSQGPPPTALKIRETTPVNSPNEDALEYALNRIIADDSFTPQGKPAKALRIEFEGTDHESSHSSIKSANRARESLFSARKHPKSCPACSESVLPTPDPLVFG